jgi:trimethylamine--corrinoid protein Co-methyltransferase
MVGVSKRWRVSEFEPAPRRHPTLEHLDEESQRAIHEVSIEIIEDIGIQINQQRAQSLLAANGGEIHENDVVTLPRDLVEQRVQDAPAEFTLHARNPDNDVTVGGTGTPVRVPGYGPTHINTFEGGRRPSRLGDYELLVKLAHVEDVIDCTGYNLCEPTDLDGAGKHLAMLKRSLQFSDKPLMASTYGAELAGDSLDMVAIAMDDPDLTKPYVAGLINTVPPRSMDTRMLGGLLTYARRGQPLIISSFTMAGASGPADLGASMAQANAENLVCITLSQIVNPGTPVVYGVPSANIDPRHGSLSIGSPESALFASFAAQMGRFYDLPSRGGGGLTDAKSVGHQSGFESTLVQSVADFAGADFVLNAAGILESYTAISPEKFVLDCEALRYLDRFRDGYSVSADSIPLDLIEATDPASHFLGEPHTLEHSDSGFYRPKAVDKRSYDDWADHGSKTAHELAHDRVRECLAAYEKPPLDDDIERDLEAFGDALGYPTV